jgi:hypothetical protein
MPASGSSSYHEGDFQRFRKSFAVLQPIGEHAKSQGLCGREGGFPRLAVDQDSGEVGDVRDPAAINLSFQFDGQAHLEKIPLSR